MGAMGLMGPVGDAGHWFSGNTTILGHTVIR